MKNLAIILALVAFLVADLMGCNSYVPGWDDCADGVDNDSDGLIDGEDPGCAASGDESGGPRGEPNDYTTDQSCFDYWAEAAWACESIGLSLVTYICVESSDGSTTLQVGCGNPGTSGTGNNGSDVTVNVTVVVESSSEGGDGTDGDDGTDGSDGESAMECADGIDNDADGLTDYPSDPGCSGPSDDDESNSSGTGTDDLGSYGCPRAYSSAVASWLSTYGTPAGIVLNDTDGDGAYNELYMLGATLSIVGGDIGILDVEPTDFAVDSQWNNCEMWADGTDDGTDDDGDGWSENDGDCDDRSAGNGPGAEEICGDGFDNDCDGSVDESCNDDADGDGYSPLEGDCDDTEVATHPGATEWGDGNDNDCDGLDD